MYKDIKLNFKTVIFFVLSVLELWKDVVLYVEVKVNYVISCYVFQTNKFLY